MEVLPHDDSLTELVGPYLLGALPAEERAAFEAHLAGCDRCAAEVRQLTPVVVALGRLAAPAAPSPAVRASLLAAVESGGGRPAAGARQARRSAAPWTTWLAAAAVLVLGLSLGVYAIQLRRAADANRFVEAVLAAPDLARVDLAGQPAAPSASARAFWSRSRGLVLTASSLPALPKNKVYQLWVVTAQPAPLSAGLLKPGDDGRVTAGFPMPSDIPAPVAVAVTIEPDGGVPAPTGDKVLVGTVN